MIVVDTTVLVYAVGGDHEFRGPCQDLIAAVERNAISATTTIEVIQEFAHVRAKRRRREDAVELSLAYTTLFSPLLVVEESDLRNGLALFQNTKELGSFDSVLAASALSVNATALVSADSGFSSLKDLTHVIPDSHGIAKLLS